MSTENDTTSTPANQIEMMPPNAPPADFSPIIDLPVSPVCEGVLQGRRRRRLKPVRISDALRKEGLDEREIAKMLRLIIERQLPGEESEEPDDKFMAELLMSCFRYFEEGNARPIGTAKLTRPVKLLHHVPRPKRSKKTKKTTKGSKG